MEYSSSISKVMWEYHKKHDKKCSSDVGIFKINCNLLKKNPEVLLFENELKQLQISIAFTRENTVPVSDLLRTEE